MKEKVYGWGGAISVFANQYFPINLKQLSNLLNKKKSYTPRGSGKSYGDSSLGSNIINTRDFIKTFEFDKKKGILNISANYTLKQIIDETIKFGWLFNVLPGSGHITIGGAIASDVHGKNHFIKGSFCNHILSIDLLISSNKIITLSKYKNRDLFNATCGGMGLTGIIISAKILLKKIDSEYIYKYTKKYYSISALINSFNNFDDYEYKIGWIDNSKNNFRSIVYFGKHCKRKISKNIKINKKIKIPHAISFFLTNQIIVKILNKIYFVFNKNNTIKIDNLYNFFFPLDTIVDFNKLYGNKGIIQYQFVLPNEYITKNLEVIFSYLNNNNIYSNLISIKKFGESNEYFLSFPQKGFTLAFDFKNTKKISTILEKLDGIILSMNGKIYLSKDQFMKETIFKKMYPKWNKFQSVRSKYVLKDKFTSIQSVRFGLQ
jgi:decaprenylphospho-beta-D-ribofuranose 2-oxidase